MLLTHLFRTIVKTGTLVIIDARGRHHSFGDGSEPSVTIKIHDKSTEWKIFFNPYLYVGESYMNGALSVEGGDIYDFLALAMINLGWDDEHWLHSAILGLRSLFRRISQFNPAKISRKNVAHHYDLSGKLYDLFLDEDRQYSCAYFEHPDDTLERAQALKKQNIAAKLHAGPDMKVLDIGCGWGGMALYLAKETGARVTGITLSEEQLTVATDRAGQAGLQDRVTFRLQDYRAVEERFDRIVSVGMFEHVGVNHYPAFFRKIRSLLTDRGVALLHTICRASGPGATNAFIRKYIFPGGYSPALSEVIPHAEKSKLYVTDVEILRLHYAETIRHWRRRFAANRAPIRELYDERFCRMWEFYLAGCEATFRYDDHTVAQIQMTRDKAVVPITRDYIAEWKQAHPVTIN